MAHTAQSHFGTVYSARFCQAITHALALQPADRPQSVADWAQEMDLRTPDGWAQFNWRLALGPSVTLGHAPSGTTAAHDTAHAATQRVDAPNGATATHPSTASNAPPSAHRLHWGRWLAGAAALLVLAGVLSRNHTPGLVSVALPPAPVAITGGAGDSGGKEASAGKALCGHEPIWKRSWCIYRECQKPGMAKTPVCVEERKRRENAIQKNNNF